MTTWKDISSAPKDGTKCLFYSPGYRRASLVRARSARMCVDAFSEEYPKGYFSFPESPYTFWCELPSPPHKEP